MLRIDLVDNPVTPNMNTPISGKLTYKLRSLLRLFTQTSNG